MLTIGNVHLTIGILVHAEEFLRYVLAEIGQELLIDNHLLACGRVLALLLGLLILDNDLLLTGVDLGVLSCRLVVCLGLAISCVLSLLEEFDVSS